MTLAAIVLAAGASLRFGGPDKLLAPYGGRPLAACAAGAVRELDPPMRIAVISSPGLREVFAGFDLVELADAAGGQSASLRAGLERARLRGAGRVLIVLADMPRVTAALMRSVLRTAGEGGVAAATDGRRAMPPACFSLTWFDRLARLEGDVGARAILRDLPSSALVVAPPGALLDIDTPADLRGAG